MEFQETPDKAHINQAVINKQELLQLHLCYALIVAGFLCLGLTTIIAALIACVERKHSGSFAKGHYSWIIRTFWPAFSLSILIPIVIALVFLLPLTLIFWPLFLVGVLVLGVTGICVSVIAIFTVIRLIIGWLRLCKKLEIHGNTLLNVDGEFSKKASANTES